MKHPQAELYSDSLAWWLQHLPECVAAKTDAACAAVRTSAAACVYEPAEAVLLQNGTKFTRPEAVAA